MLFHTVTSENTWTATDAHAVMPGHPVIDASQDVTFIEMGYSPALGAWAGEVARKVKTCDAAADVAVVPGHVHTVMW